jgi:hypothetical protein
LDGFHRSADSFSKNLPKSRKQLGTFCGWSVHYNKLEPNVRLTVWHLDILGKLIATGNRTSPGPWMHFWFPTMILSYSYKQRNFI